MAIPGLRPKFEVRAKVRIGEKRKSANGKEYPASLDHFVCDDPEFARLCGDKPKSITILLPFAEPDANFSTGLEWWRGKQLTCYSKGDTIRGIPVAYRVESMVGEDQVLSEEMKGKERRQILCPVRDCEFLKKKDCKPMGRLQFILPGLDPSGGVFQMDTKSWNAIEQIEGLLSVLGDPRGRPLTLKVDMVQKGRDKFPVISLEVQDMEVNTLEEADEADAQTAAIAELDKAVTDTDPSDQEIKVAMAALLDITHTGWRDRPDFIEAMKKRIEKDGVIGAGKVLLKNAVTK
jgi:hypothetical protein